MGSFEDFMIDKAVKDGAEDEKRRDRIRVLSDALKDLIRAYVILMEAGRDRIIALGGECDPVETMERGDSYLRKAREALATK